MYFIYSKQQHDLLSRTNKSIGMTYTPGKINVRGTVQMFTEISSKPESIYSDFIIVYYNEDVEPSRYTMPSVV